mmetsp:Transcript_19/g.18  ORF Transcript_19/g.18 Transcript_19/m.18 type:complete len:425 (+) Transcript_19:296-1570(+)|eukprot:CAMPEP_0113476592 /NCGR_PEP_ID=MMETSP0014_2-20120614/19750_1 /TAXON_ID=2857 /ORGANISM="Nitzschia sp." /LENGTH=424 /DNA_ID=CAMNT_0000369617 /DNA_START=107 /DNA_END=1381 /DNA_ORIENTATION=- /assembly_acc=CAM_ASM_000159
MRTSSKAATGFPSSLSMYIVATILCSLLYLYSIETIHRLALLSSSGALPLQQEQQQQLLKGRDSIPLDDLTSGRDSKLLTCPITATTTTSMPQDGIIKEETRTTNNLRVIHNRIVSQSSSTSRIPRIIHQTSKSRCVPTVLWEGSERWKDRFPHYDYFFHDDGAMERLIRHVSKSYPMLSMLGEIWDCLEQGAMKADVWRSAVLFQYGGVYADVDSWPNHLTSRDVLGYEDNKDNNNDDSHDHDHKEDRLDAVFFPDFDDTLSFHFIAIRPKHPLMMMMLQIQMNNVYWQTDTKHVQTVVNTGPYALRNAVLNWLRLASHVTPTVSFVPTTRNRYYRHYSSHRAKNKDLTPGLYTVDGSKLLVLSDHDDDRNYWVERDASMMTPKDKKELYSTMNMTYFRDDMLLDSNRTCTKILLAKATSTSK